MADRRINSILDRHFNNQKTYIPYVKKPGILSIFKEKISLFFMGMKNYFFPPSHYEHTSYTQDSFMVVHKVDRGIIKHLKYFFKLISAFFLVLFESLRSLLPKKKEKIDFSKEKIQFNFKKNSDDDDWTETSIRNMLWKKHQDKSREKFWEKRR